MRVLQLISSSGLYGAERVLLELACFLNTGGNRCHVGALQAPGQDQVENHHLARDVPLILVGNKVRIYPMNTQNTQVLTLDVLCC